MGSGVWGLGFGVWGLGFGVWGLGFGVRGSGFGAWDLNVLRDLLPFVADATLNYHLAVHTRWGTKLSLGPGLGVLRVQICIT